MVGDTARHWMAQDIDLPMDDAGVSPAATPIFPLVHAAKEAKVGEQSIEDWLEEVVADAFDSDREGEQGLEGTDRRVRAVRILERLGFARNDWAKGSIGVLAAALRALRVKRYSTHTRLHVSHRHPLSPFDDPRFEECKREPCPETRAVLAQAAALRKAHDA